MTNTSIHVHKQNVTNKLTKTQIRQHGPHEPSSPTLDKKHSPQNIQHGSSNIKTQEHIENGVQQTTKTTINM